MISSKISKTICILNKIKHSLPLNIRLMIYNTLIASHFNYGILVWGYQCDKLFKLQKRAIRCITLSRYNAHTEPIFKSLKVLKIQHIFDLAQLKFYHKYIHIKLPYHFQNFSFVLNENFHGRCTRKGIIYILTEYIIVLLKNVSDTVY